MRRRSILLPALSACLAAAGGDAAARSPADREECLRLAGSPFEPGNAGRGALLNEIRDPVAALRPAAGRFTRIPNRLS